MDHTHGDDQGSVLRRDSSSGWKNAEESWIVLDREKNGGTPPLSVQFVETPQHPDSKWFEEGISSDEDMPENLTAAISMGLDAIQDPMAQADRSLGLAVSLDGIDSDFLKRTSEAISQRTNQHSPTSRASTASSLEDDFLEEEEPGVDGRGPVDSVLAPVIDAEKVSRRQGLKYGGRAPPILGALAPPVVSVHNNSASTKNQSGTGKENSMRQVGDVSVTKAKTKSIEAEKRTNEYEVGKEDTSCHPPGKKSDSGTDETSCSSTAKVKRVNFGMLSMSKREKDYGVNKLDKAERRRLRREHRARKSNGKATPNDRNGFSHWAINLSSGFGLFNLKTVVPLVVSHVFTLLLGIYIGRQYQQRALLACPSNTHQGCSSHSSKTSMSITATPL